MTPTADLSASLLSRFTQLSARPSADHAAFNVSPADAFAVLNVLRDESGYDMLVDVTAVDWGVEATPRFTVLWHLFSTKEHNYLRIASDLAPAASDDANAQDLSDAAMPFAPSVVALWPSADWHERETYDLFGIRFLNHPDLRRILMWDGYPYHPLRKDFPLAGIDTPLPDLEVADITQATVKPAPMMGGPFVASTGKMNLTEAEPRAKDESWTERREKPETD